MVDINIDDIKHIIFLIIPITGIFLCWVLVSAYYTRKKILLHIRKEIEELEKKGITKEKIRERLNQLLRKQKLPVIPPPSAKSKTTPPTFSPQDIKKRVEVLMKR